MLLTITTTAEPASDLGFLLHKHPGPGAVVRPVAWASAHVFYPEAGDAADDRRAAARGRSGRPRSRPSGAGGRGLRARPVRERPSVRGLEHARGRDQGGVPHRAHRPLRQPPGAGRLAHPARAAHAGAALPRRDRPRAAGLRAARLAGRRRPRRRSTRRSRAGASRATWTSGWPARVRLADALNHLYVLLPVLDDAKHYWVSTDEVDKLVRAGGDWLAGHPEKELITRRYLAHSGELTGDALARLAEVDDAEPEELDNALEGARIVAEPDQPAPLSEQRRGAVLAAVRAAGATARRRPRLRRGRAGPRPARRPRHRAGRGHRRVRPGAAGRRAQAQARPDERAASAIGCEIFQSSLTYRDDRLAGLDAAVLMEVIEHVDPPRLEALERVVFGVPRPRPRSSSPRRTSSTTSATRRCRRARRGTATTASSGPARSSGTGRRRWPAATATACGSCRSGADDPEVGPPTQMAVFDKHRRRRATRPWHGRHPRRCDR